MLSAILIENEFALLAPVRGQFPVQALVVHPSGWVRVDLLPVVSIVMADGLLQPAVQFALGLATRNRDAMLSVWAASPAPIAPGLGDGPRAVQAMYDTSRQALAIRLQGGAALTFPATLVPGLTEADPAAAADILVAGGGEVLVWRRLGLFARMADVVLAATGGPAWRDRLTTAHVPPWHVPAIPPKALEKPLPVAPGMVKSLLGLILQRENYLSAEALHVIFHRQMELKQQGRDLNFGQVAMESGLISPERLQFAVHLQERLAHSPDGGKPLGVYLLESAALMPSQLMTALDEQRDTGRRLGEILVERQLISADLLRGFLSRQQAVRGVPTSAVEQQAPVPVAPTPPPEPGTPSPAPEAAQPAAPPATPPDAPPAHAPEAVAPPPAETITSEPSPAAAPTPVAPPEPAAPIAVPESPRAPPPTPEAPRVQSLLGVILEREGYLNQVHVRAITAEQERLKAEGRRTTFGEVALNLKLITTEQLKFAIGLQKRLAYDSGKSKPLGLILVENGVVKPSQIHLALEEQGRTGKRLGDILVDQGLINDGMLAVFLGMQRV